MPISFCYKLVYMTWINFSLLRLKLNITQPTAKKVYTIIRSLNLPAGPIAIASLYSKGRSFNNVSSLCQIGNSNIYKWYYFSAKWKELVDEEIYKQHWVLLGFSSKQNTWISHTTAVKVRLSAGEGKWRRVLASSALHD